ncbi:MAG TPA: transposase [Gemmataceae bacterium]
MPPIRQRPHRLPREHYRGPVAVAITACVQDRHPAFRDPEIVDTFRTLLDTAVTTCRCFVPIYCFMPEHLHLILHGRDDLSDTWAAMVAFKQRSGYWFGRNRPAIHWQGDFYDHVIRADEDLYAQVRYTADNPVRRGLVRVWSEYPYTGAIGVDLRAMLLDIATDASAMDSRRGP